MSDSLSAPQPAGLTGLSRRALLRLVMPTLFAAVLLFFALKAPGFLTVGNLSSLLLNNFVLLAIVAIGDASKIRDWMKAYGPLTEMKLTDPRFSP